MRSSAFLDLWELGLAEWRQHREEMIERYPQHFAVDTPEDIAFMKDYVAQHDWVVDDVRFDQKWADDESSIFDLMRQTGVIGDDVTDPPVPAPPKESSHDADRSRVPAPESGFARCVHGRLPRARGGGWCPW